MGKIKLPKINTIGGAMVSVAAVPGLFFLLAKEIIMDYFDGKYDLPDIEKIFSDYRDPGRTAFALYLLLYIQGPKYLIDNHSNFLTDTRTIREQSYGCVISSTTLANFLATIILNPGYLGNPLEDKEVYSNVEILLSPIQILEFEIMLATDSKFKDIHYQQQYSKRKDLRKMHFVSPKYLPSITYSDIKDSKVLNIGSLVDVLSSLEPKIEIIKFFERVKNDITEPKLLETVENYLHKYQSLNLETTDKGQLLTEEAEFIKDILEIHPNVKKNKISVQIVKFSIINLRLLYKIIEIPPSISNLKRLKDLSVSHCETLESIPKEIGLLESLESLKIINCRISMLPSSIGNLTNLKEIQISSCKLSQLPSSFRNLENLRTCRIYRNEFEEVPDEINLSKLETLVMSQNSISAIPDFIFNMDSLVQLNLRFNNIEHIPDKISNMKQLKRLELGSNQIEVIPNSISSLTNLEYLNLSGNNLKSIPEGIIELVKKLEDLEIKLCDNNISQEIILNSGIQKYLSHSFSCDNE